MKNKKIKKGFGYFMCILLLLGWGYSIGIQNADANAAVDKQVSSQSHRENMVISPAPQSLQPTVVTSDGIKETLEPATSPGVTKAPQITKIYFPKKTVQVWPKGKIYNPPCILETGASYSKISWSVNHTKYASVNKKGKVTLKTKGAGKKVKVTATVHYKEKGAAKTLSASYTLCGKQPVKNITISSKKNYILVGKKSKISAVYSPKNATKKSVVWSSSNKAYATISPEGVICAKSEGAGKIVTFTAKSKDGFKAEKSIKLRIFDTKKPMVALTFDDGPSVSYTTRILKQLKKYNARATFFVVGMQMQSKAAQDLVKKSAKYGNEIASHTFYHRRLTALSVPEIKKESLDTNNLIHKITGKYPALTRPPYGSVNSTVKSTITTPLIMWSIDTRDWQTRNSSTTISKVLNQVHDGDIVLMHDLYDATATAAEALIPQLVNKGYQLVTVSELAELKNIKLTNGNIYNSIR